MNQATVELTVIEALPEDFKEFRGWFADGKGGKVRKYQRRKGQLFFIRSKTTMKFEGPYIIGGQTDMAELKAWLDRKAVFIPRRFPDSNIKTINEEVAAAS